MVKRVFRWCQVHYFMESVFSMDESDRAVMSEHMETLPYLVEASDISVCRRPRLYWLSWEIHVSPEVSLMASQHDGWAKYWKVQLKHEVDVSSVIAEGWQLHDSDKLPTFTTSRPRSSPGNRPAGLWQCEDHEIARWKADHHRYPPYVYRDKHCLVNGKGEFRLPTIGEKEVMMGFPLGYTSSCLPKGQQTKPLFDDTRHTLIGNSWHVPVISFLLLHLFKPLGLTSLTGLADIMRSVQPGGDRQLQGYLRRPPLRPVKGLIAPIAEEVLAKKMANFVSIKGEDLLLQADSENTVKFHRLRASVPAKLWRWKAICGWPWRRAGYHINVLEMQAVLTCLQWRLGRKRQQRCRFIHLTDSLVVLHALSRGRSSSRKMRSVLSKVNALLLATDVHPLWAYVSTKQNPADRPSRKPVIKRWGKKQSI